MAPAAAARSAADGLLIDALSMLGLYPTPPRSLCACHVALCVLHCACAPLVGDSHGQAPRFDPPSLKPTFKSCPAFFVKRRWRVAASAWP